MRDDGGCSNAGHERTVAMRRSMYVSGACSR
jgi:hypothetical protein